MSVTNVSNSSQAKPPSATGRTRHWELKLWRGGVFLYAAISVWMFVVYTVGSVNTQRLPFPGFFPAHTLIVSPALPVSGEVWNGIEAGLIRGDILMRINGETLVEGTDYAAARQRYLSILASQAIGDVLRVEVLRDSSQGNISAPGCTPSSNNANQAECSFAVTLQRFPPLDVFAFLLLPALTGIITLALGFITLARYHHRYEGLIVAFLCLATSNFASGIYDSGFTHQYTWFWVLNAAWIGSAFVTSSILFPNRLGIVWKYPWVKYVAPVLATLAGLLIYTTGNAPTDRLNYTFVQSASAIGGLGILLQLLFVTNLQRRLALNGVHRDQVNAVIIGNALLFVPLGLWLINRLLLSGTQITIPLSIEALLPLLIFPNVANVYALFQVRRLNSDQVISQGLTYGLMLSALLVSVYLITLGGTLIALDVLNASSIVTISLVLFVMVTGFTPLRNRLQDKIDEVYYRRRRDFQEKVEEYATSLAASSDFNDALRMLSNIVEENISPSGFYVFLVRQQQEGFVNIKIAERPGTDLRFSGDSATAILLAESDQPIILDTEQPIPQELWIDRARLELLRANVLIPIVSSERLNGFVVVAPPRGKIRYSFEEIRFLNNLVSQFAVATERAQVLESLQRRVRELDVLSQVGQAVNFTIEFDDLLELINTQTSKLIPAPCFYIALYDETNKQYSFVFFQENDDRLSEKEQLRLPLDQGVISDIIRTGAAQRLSDYHAESQRRGVERDLLAPDVRAWMGVPLLAARRTLGVMAVGKRGAAATYTDEQFKIFSDIGALAATSIDKARLFSETKMRERQLTVLNDISRQLVATEKDVEKLLQLILESAVDILGGEAGSLLLNTEEASSELEFRVVVGGSGQELVGTRISASTGIAGQVVKTGRPIIVDDVDADKRHNADVSAYQARSLLAVPLIAKDSVIGVLEILNKSDGTPFSSSDSDLLTTFAGQAAVAIENARLFQMTDLQLSQRVKELETLERIDGELNRTLNLSVVASITVRSAMRTLNAEAAALGIVHEKTGKLEIIAIEGYGTHEYPPDAEGMMWPLDRGIVRRVMRSKQADIAVDVDIDPDYDGGLTGSLSQITLPMFSGNDINAILILEKRALPRFNLADWAFSQRIADHASIAIANAQLYAALTEANKSKSDFMGFAAHELKTPLTSVRGYADALAMMGGLNEMQASFVKTINANAGRMQTIIDDLRASAQMDANEFRVVVEPMDLRRAVVEALRPLVPFLNDKQQELLNEVPEGLPLVMGDETRLIQVITNLITNAHKYSPNSTLIRVYTTLIPNFVDKQGKSRGTMIRLSVEDHGLGISEDDIKRLFNEKYFRSTNQAALDQPGTGLGMVLTQGIILKHGGEIWVESKLGEGSTFHFVVPLATPEAELQIGE